MILKAINKSEYFFYNKPLLPKICLTEVINLYETSHFLSLNNDLSSSGLQLYQRGSIKSKSVQSSLIKRKFYFISQYKSNKNSWKRTLFDNDIESVIHFKLKKSASKFHLYTMEVTPDFKGSLLNQTINEKVPIYEYNGILFLQCFSIEVETAINAITTPLLSSFNLLMEDSYFDTYENKTVLALDSRIPFLTQITDTFRVIHRGEIDDFTIDYYNGFLLICGYMNQLNSRALFNTLTNLIKTIKGSLKVEGGMIRTQNKNPHNNKVTQDFFYFGKEVPKNLVANENKLLYGISLEGSKHTGLFLDHRDSRKRIANISKNKRVANLFAFTCSFSIAAAAFDAEVVFSIDLAGSALQRGMDNFEINQLTQKQCGKFVKEDVRKWLEREVRKHEIQGDKYRYWDIIICDPPVFASSKNGNFSVKKAWPDLVKQCSQILNHDGVALFSNNHRSGDPNYYQTILNKEFKTVTPLSPPIDFPTSANKNHVHIYWCLKNTI